MTADEVRGVVFQKVAIGGYKQSDVDLFLDEVAVCIESMTAKIRALEKAKFEAAGQPAEPQEKAAAPVEPEIKIPKPIEVKKEEKQPEQYTTNYGIESLLVRAQNLARQIDEEARLASQQLLEKTAEDAKEIIARADSQAAETIEKANALLAEAERKEASISAAARAEAENIINEAVARSGRMLTATREKLKTEQELCDKLRTEFTQVKNVIVGFYEEQLGELKGLSIDTAVAKTEAAENVVEKAEKVEKTAEEKKEKAEPKAEPEEDNSAEIALNLAGEQE